MNRRARHDTKKKKKRKRERERETASTKIEEATSREKKRCGSLEKGMIKGKERVDSQNEKGRRKTENVSKNRSRQNQRESLRKSKMKKDIYREISSRLFSCNSFCCF